MTTFDEKARAIFGATDTSAPPFQLRTNQHTNENVTGEYKNDTYDILDITKKPSTNYSFEEGETDPVELVPQPPPETAPKKILICVKRKRDEEPLDDFYLEVDDTQPQKKRIKNVHDVTDALEKSLSLSSEVKEKKKVRFALVETVSQRQTDTDKKILGRIRERKTLKQEASPSNMKEKNLKKMKQKQEIRIAKILEKKRLDETTNVVDMNFGEETELANEFDDPSLKNYASLLREQYIQASDEKYEYDYYYVSDTTDQSVPITSTIVKMESFNDDIFYDDREYNPREDSDYDSDDSNRSDNIQNDYPDEFSDDSEDEQKSDSSDDEGDDRLSFEESYMSRPKKHYQSDEDDDEEEMFPDDEYVHNDEYYNY
jgi:hypothetical protein